jgi:hypothetical protein
MTVTLNQMLAEQRVEDMLRRAECQRRAATVPRPSHLVPRALRGMLASMFSHRARVRDAAPRPPRTAQRPREQANA